MAGEVAAVEDRHQMQGEAVAVVEGAEAGEEEAPLLQSHPREVVVVVAEVSGRSLEKRRSSARD